MKRNKLLLIGVLTILLAACGDKETTIDSSVATENEQTEQVAQDVAQLQAITFVDDLGNKHEFEATPSSVATLNPGIMDILLELGANVTGRPQITSEMTDEIERIQEIGNPHNPSFEQIATVNAEILIVPPSFAKHAATVEATGTKVIYANMSSVDDIKSTIEKYGELFGSTKKAEQLIAEIDEQVADASDKSTLNALIVYGAPGTYLAALDNSLYGDILKKAGGNNIASDLPATEKYPSYANLSVEKIVERNPQVIMLITHSDPTEVQEGFERQMSENAAWKNLDAIKNEQVIILPANLFDNPGTQVVEALDYMRQVLKTAEEAMQ